MKERAQVRGNYSVREGVGGGLEGVRGAWWELLGVGRGCWGLLRVVEVGGGWLTLH